MKLSAEKRRKILHALKNGGPDPLDYTDAEKYWRDWDAWDKKKG